MKFMPEFATQLPLPIYDFFYFITVNPAPISPAEFDSPAPILGSRWMKYFLVKSSQKVYLLLPAATLNWDNQSWSLTVYLDKGNDELVKRSFNHDYS